MKLPGVEKTFLSPFVAVVFAVIAATGVLLFFHVKNGPIMSLHEWFGWIFVVAGTVHTALNIRPLLAYLRRPAAQTAVGVAMVLAVLLSFAGARHEQEHKHRGYEVPTGRSPSSSSAMP